MTQSLPIFCDLLHPQGVIYLPLSVHILTQVMIHEKDWKHLFLISFVHQDDVSDIDLVVGSHDIPDELYRCVDTFGGKDQKPECIFGVSERMIAESAPTGADVQHLKTRLRKLVNESDCSEDPLSFSFIKLAKL
jgi:hypothetical protein